MKAPTAPEAERAVIGAILLDNNALDEVASVIRPSDFTVPRHTAWYEKMVLLRSEGKPIDSVTMGDEDVQRTASEVPTAVNVVFYARQVAEASARRQLMVMGASLAQRAESDDDIVTVLGDAQRDILEITTRSRDEHGELIGVGLGRTMDELERRIAGYQGNGVSWGIDELDEVLGPLSPAHMDIVGARPGVGKTALAINTVVRAAGAGFPALYFSLEMSTQELHERALSMLSGIPCFRIRGASPRYPITVDEWNRIITAKLRLAKYPITIDDRSRRIEQIVSEARRWRSRNPGPCVVVVDYAQLVEAPGRKQQRNREQEVAEVSRMLKSQVAKGMDVAVLLLAQLNRDNAKSKERPRMHNLRESGALEADADSITLLHRDVEDSEARTTEAIVDKNRHGKTGIKIIGWNGPTMTFASVEPDRPMMFNDN